MTKPSTNSGFRFFGELNTQLPSQLAEVVAEPDLFNEEMVDSNVLFIQQI